MNNEYEAYKLYQECYNSKRVNAYYYSTWVGVIYMEVVLRKIV